MSGVLLPKQLSCTEKLILLYVYIQGKHEYSVSSLERSLGVSRKSVHLALRHLIADNYLEVIEYPKGRRGGVYCINTSRLEGTLDSTY